MSDLVNSFSLLNYDKTIQECIQREQTRQDSNLQLIASENFASKAVLQVQGSILTNKYAEGYPKKRYYSGCMHVDEIEEIAKSRLKDLFKAKYVNVQPHSGSQANQAVFLSLLKPGDKILGMSMDSGGHLTHGSFVNMSGKWFESFEYGLEKQSLQLDYEQIQKKAMECRPKLIIAGYSSYNQSIDFKKFKEIADKVGAYLLADIAHISGIIAAGYHQNPLEYAHIVTSTTHKTLRGPRGGIIMTNDHELYKKINSGVFPGIQGGPLMHVIAAKAVAFAEAQKDSFKTYIKNVLDNAVTMSRVLQKRGYNTSGNTQNHIVLLDLRDKKITGKEAADILEKNAIVVNKNVVPFDNVSPFITSGIRMGTAACTTKGMKEKEFVQIGNYIADILDRLSDGSYTAEYEDSMKKQVIDFCSKFTYSYNW